MKTIQIVPAILPNTFKDITDNIIRVENSAKVVQIDICDGKFTSSSTWPFVKGQIPVFNDDFEMPSWEKVDFELDLMVQKPLQYIDNLKNLGFSKGVLHIASDDQDGILSAAKALDKYMISVGLAVTNDTDLESLYTLIALLEAESIYPYVQVMGIKEIGKQGQPFDERTLLTLKTIREKYPSLDLQVDGSVTSNNINNLVEAGATRLAVGSWLFGVSSSASDRLQTLKSLL